MIDSQSLPYFLNTTRSLVYKALARTVILVCRVRNLGNRVVSKTVKGTVIGKSINWVLAPTIPSKFDLFKTLKTFRFPGSDSRILTVGETSYTNTVGVDVLEGTVIMIYT